MILERWRLLAGVVGLGLLLPAVLFDLRIPDEPRVAHTSFEMYRTGEFVVPTVNGKPFLQTPPLHYWLLGAWLRIADVGLDGLARVPSVLFSLGTVALVSRMAWRRSGSRAAFMSAGVLAGTMGFWDGAQRAVVDVSMTFFVVLSIFHVAEALAAGDLSVRRGLWSGAAAGCAFLAKGLPGPVIIASAAALPLCLGRTLERRPLAVWAAAGAAAFLAVALPWTLLLWRRDPAFVNELLFSHVSARFLEGAHHDPSNFTFLHRSLLKLLPWGLALPFALPLALRSLRRSREEHNKARAWNALLLSWLVVPVLLLLVSRSKRNIYLLPVFPAFALVVALWLERFVQRGHSQRWIQGLVWSGVLLLPVGGVIYERLSTEESTLAPLGSALRELERGGSRVVGYRLYEREESAIAWYLRHPFESTEEAERLAAAAQELGSRAVFVGEQQELREAIAKAGAALSATTLERSWPSRRRNLEVRRLTVPD